MSLRKRKGRALKGMAVDRLDGVSSPATTLPFLIKKSDDPDEIREAAKEVQDVTSNALMKLFKSKGFQCSKEAAEELAALADSVGIEGYEQILKAAVMPSKKAPPTKQPGKSNLFGRKKKSEEESEEETDDDSDEQPDPDDEEEEEEQQQEEEDESISAASVQKHINKVVAREVRKATAPISSAIAELASLITGEDVEFVEDDDADETENQGRLRQKACDSNGKKKMKKQKGSDRPLTTFGGGLRITKEDLSSRRDIGQDTVISRHKVTKNDEPELGSGLFEDIVFGAPSRPQ